MELMMNFTVIACGCKKGCNNRCGCYKLGLRCRDSCNCPAEVCQNRNINQESDLLEDDDGTLVENETDTETDEEEMPVKEDELF